jgi:hypothetical protein
MIKILFRPPDYLDLSEEEVAKTYFDVIRNRVDVQKGDIVVGRYSVLPFYKELETDLNKLGAKLINTYRQHQYIADIKEWYEDLKDFTPKTWFRLEDVPDNKGPFVVKGQTNSRKDRWRTHMFANTKREAVETALRLQEDSLISTQDIYVREFVPLNNYMVGLNGMPISEEYRFFICNEFLLSGAYYWSNYLEDIGFTPSARAVPDNFLAKIITAIGNKANFYVVDIAKTQSGEWIVVELNDGQMSGLSCNDPDDLYSALKWFDCEFGLLPEE